MVGSATYWPVCRCLIIKLFIQVVTMITNHNQSYNRHTWIGTYHKVTNHRPDRTSQNATALSGPGKLDKLSQNAQAQRGYPRVQCKYALDKRGCRSPNPQTCRAPLRRTHSDKLSCIKQRTTGQES